MEAAGRGARAREYERKCVNDQTKSWHYPRDLKHIMLQLRNEKERNKA